MPALTDATRSSGELVVCYDLDCGFCRWAMGLLLVWDRRGRLVPCAIQSPDGERLLAPVAPAERLESWHVVDAAGCVYSSGAAFAPTLRELRAGAPLAALAERVPTLVDAGYRWVARNRSWLSRLVPRGAKASADERLAVHSQHLASVPALRTRRC